MNLVSTCVGGLTVSLKRVLKNCLAGWLISDCVALDCASEETKGLPEGVPGWLADIGLSGGLTVSLKRV
jgi:hypothetical protein